MALAYLPLAILIIFNSNNENCVRSSSDNSTSAKIPKQILDPKRRNDLVDEAFLEQKDILLSMLENKLKEVRDKKRKRTDRSETLKEITSDANECKLLPSDVDLKLKASGIVGIGETDLQLKFGESGNSMLDLNATGISNVGKSSIKLGVGDGNIHVPGLQDLLNGASLVKSNCEKQNRHGSEKRYDEEKRDVIPIDLINRRSLEVPSGVGNESSLSSTAETPQETDPSVYDTTQNENENVTESITTQTENADV
ncbi:hypothetical protein KGM_210800 [Danaus plexippus plexippus]|uniref:Uncharacterized protein n=1 Tax=Danaus plexippus plexippus TaxID=278856 RepID=A0A212F2H4_DANPL|nr:hypothetical protein KGM_210800 [Danaus plexippus plexippus]